jgi:hypothetical protein
MIDLKTYGDLKKLINSISKKQKGEKIISKGKEFALDQVLGLIPGASNAKTAFDFIKTAILKPDTKKTDTWLDKLDIDDAMSKIVDDTVENGFMQAMAKAIENESDSKSLEDDFNMNAKMVDYLKSTYSGRTIAGIKENTINKNTMKKLELKQLIKEEITKILTEATPVPPTNAAPIKQTAASTAYKKTAQTSTALSTKATQVKSINDLPGVFETWFTSLGLKDKAGVSQSTIIPKIKDTLTKMGIK